MKKYLLSIVLFCFYTTLSAQNKGYNIYEINRGEILKKDYQNLAFLFNNLYSATEFKSDVKDYSDADLTGVIDDHENKHIDFIYRDIEKVRVNRSFGNQRYIQISNGKGRALFTIENNKVKQKTEFDFLKFRPFLFNQTFLSGYNGFCQLLNLQTDSFTKTEFVDVEPLTDSLIATKDINYNWGIMDNEGNVILKNKFGRVRNLTSSMVCFEIKDSIGLVNDNGKVILPPIFKKITSGKKLVFAYTFSDIINKDINKTIRERLSSYIVTVKKDNRIIETIYDNEEKTSGKCGAFDFDGNMQIPFKYDLLENGINNNVISATKNKFGILSPNGTVLVKHVYDEIKVFPNAFYITKINARYDLLNTSLKELLPAKYQIVFPISNKEVLVLDKNKWHKIIFNGSIKTTKSLNFSSDVRFNYFDTYSVKLDEYVINKDFFQITDNNGIGVIGKNLNVIIAPKYERGSEYFNDKYFHLKKNGNSIYFNSKGKELKNIDLSRNYYDDDISFNKTLICTRNKKYGVISLDGSVLVPFNYSYIQNIDGKKFVVSK